MNEYLCFWIKNVSYVKEILYCFSPSLTVFYVKSSGKEILLVLMQ